MKLDVSIQYTMPQGSEVLLGSEVAIFEVVAAWKVEINLFGKVSASIVII